MPKMNFAKKDIAELKLSGKQVDYFDTDTSGSGLRGGKMPGPFSAKWM